MAQYTILTLDEAQQIVQHYGLGTLTDMGILTGGSQNTNYKFQTTEGQFVCTVCEQKSFVEAAALPRLLEYLKAHGFVTSEVIRSKEGEVVVDWQGKPVMLKNFLPGKIIDDLSPALLELIGRELGKLHLIPPPDDLPTELSFGMEQFHLVGEYASGSDYEHWLNKQKTRIEDCLASPLPRAFIHSDVFSNNVIINDDETTATIMDFEEAANYYRVFDVGMTLVGLCKSEDGIDLLRAKHVLKGYRSVIELTSYEREYLQIFTSFAAATMSFWRHRQFNYLYPTPALKNHYLALKQVADFMDALPAGSLGT